jgi:hypothetical protein
MCATKPTPQFSRSFAGSYSPVGGADSWFGLTGSAEMAGRAEEEVEAARERGEAESVEEDGDRREEVGVARRREEAARRRDALRRVEEGRCRHAARESMVMGGRGGGVGEEGKGGLWWRAGEVQGVEGEVQQRCVLASAYGQ